MSHLPFVKRELRKVLVVGIITLASLLLPTPLLAETISPSVTEVTQSITDVSNESVTISNDKNYDIYITPQTYKYYPQNEFVEDLETYEEFVKIDTDSILIPANSSKTISFQVLGLKSLDPGTYYNLIIFSQQLDNQKKEDTNIGTTANISHLVILNLTTNPDLEQITQEYDIDIQVENKEYPFSNLLN